MTVFLLLCILATLVYIAWLMGQILPGIAAILAAERRARPKGPQSFDMDEGQMTEERPANTWRMPSDTKGVP